MRKRSWQFRALWYADALGPVRRVEGQLRLTLLGHWLRLAAVLLLLMAFPLLFGEHGLAGTAFAATILLNPTARSVFALIGWFPVKLYGAKGDGVADDTTKCQDALNAATVVRGGVVVFALGVYLLTASLTCKSNVTLLGPNSGNRAGEYGITAMGGAVLTLGGAKNFDLVKNDDSVNGNTGIEIESVTFNYNTGPVADVGAITFSKVRRSAIRNVAILGGATTSRRAVYITNGSEIITLRECYLEGGGIWSDGASNSVTTDNCEVGQGAIYQQGGFNHHVVNSQIYKDGISSDDLIGDCVRWTDVSEGTLAYNNISGSYNGHGVYFNRGVKRSVVLGNHSYNNGRKIAGTWSGIVLDSDTAAHPTEKNVLIGNVCFDRQGTKTQKYGISVVSFSGTQTNSNTIKQNTLLDNRDGGLSVVAGLSNSIGDNVQPASDPLPVLASAATITAEWGSGVYSVTGTTNITSITAAPPRTRITLIFAGALTLTDGSNLKLNGNFVTTADDTSELVCDGTNWYETARSVN